MAAIKSYTDIEQSKKLAEILPLESADMHFINNKHAGCVPYLEMSNGSNPWLKGTYISPCWSLATLLDIIPKCIKEYNILRTDIGENDFAIWYDEIGFGVNSDLPNITTEYAVDACYEMIIKLKEQNLL